MSLQELLRGHPKTGNYEVPTKAPRLGLPWACLGVAEGKEATHGAGVEVTLCPSAGASEDVEGEQGKNGLDHGGFQLKKHRICTTQKYKTIPLLATISRWRGLYGVS